MFKIMICLMKKKIKTLVDVSFPVFYTQAALNKDYEEIGGKGDRPGTGRRSSSRVSFNEGDSGDDSDDEDSGTKSSRTGLFVYLFVLLITDSLMALCMYFE